MMQHRVAEQLLTLVQPLVNGTPDSALEIGCCTGILTRKLVARFSGLSLLHINDLVADFGIITKQLDFRGQVQFLAGDIEKLSLPRQYQLIISSSTFHWLHNLKAVLHTFRRHLQANGILAFSMYGPDNMQEIRKLTGEGLEYSSMEQVTALLERSFQVLEASQHRETMHFPDAAAVLLHLRETGVNALARKGWSRRRLQEFSSQYEKLFRDQEGVCLTYHPMYFLACSQTEQRVPLQGQKNVHR